jgi:UDP-2,4-diacetamido-2,4,6-trideoxy-beta-L-altropyranose hydrolase
LKIVFRTDASLQIGTGHVMRCLTLADALRDKGAEVIFISREHPGNINRLIEQKNFDIYKLSLSDGKEKVADAVSAHKLLHAEWLGASQHQDALQCEPLLQDFKPDWLVVDHYAIDCYWQRMLKPHYQKLMVIDDLADRQHDCDLLLDQTYGRNTEDYKSLVPTHAKLLLGAGYALLRPEFAEWRDFSLKRRVNPELKSLLITMGGVDADNVTGCVLAALRDCILPNDLKITVVMGGSAPWLEQVKLLAGQMPNPTEVKVNVTNMAEIMAHSDLAIGAAGSTSWERCCLGLPTLMLVLAKNQKLASCLLSEFGAAQALHFSDPKNFTKIINKSLCNVEQLWEMGALASQVTDGGGVARVAAKFFE